MVFEVKSCQFFDRTSTLLDFQEDETQDEEDADPSQAGDEPELDGQPALHAPAPAHDVPHGLGRAGAWQVPGHRLKVAGHSLHRPEDAGQQEDRVEAANGQLHGRRLGRAHDGDEEA